MTMTAIAAHASTPVTGTASRLSRHGTYPATVPGTKTVKTKVFNRGPMDLFMAAIVRPRLSAVNPRDMGRPSGTLVDFLPYPALKRGANLARPSGACLLLRC